MQVLFFEQLQLRHAIAGSLLANDLNIGVPPQQQQERRQRDNDSACHSHLQLQHHQEEEKEEEGEFEEREGNDGRRGERDTDTWRVAVRENQVLRLDMDSMRSRVQELERECSNMKRTIAKIEKRGGEEGGWRSSFTKKFGCKFKTQVCDSHEPTVVETRKSRHHRQMSSS